MTRRWGRSAAGGGDGTLVRDEAPAPTAFVPGRHDRNIDTKVRAAMDLAIFVPLLVIMGAFMFFASRRQKKALQATVNLHDSLAIGDEIMTTAGLFGIITDVSDSKVDVEVAPGVVVTMLKVAVKEKVSDDDDEDEYEDDHDGAVDESTAHELDRPSAGTEVKSDPDRLTKD
jgi:preprotein translocase subunit YajC